MLANKKIRLIRHTNRLIIYMAMQPWPGMVATEPGLARLEGPGRA
jgi:hypothetical protein